MSPRPAARASLACPSPASAQPGLRLGLGIALAAGVPALVLVSIEPVAAVAGPLSVLVWPLAALVGLLMARSFRELAAAYPARRGGVAVLAANVLRSRSLFLARLAQWSYWLGWSPAMALSAALVASYVTTSFFPGASPWLTWALATGILAAMAAVNRCGLRPCALMQLTILAAVTTPIAVGALALLAGTFRPSRLTPFEPPGGWLSGHGALALCGAFFLAGWSAYGAEISLTFGPEYRRGARDAVRALFVVAAVVVLVYTVVPLLVIGSFGAEPPTFRGSSIAAIAGHGWAAVAVGLLVATALLSTLNMIAAADARVICEMSRTGDAWPCLGRTDSTGVPRNALAFDVVANSGFLAAGLLLSHGDVAALPVTLLAAASVGYFVSLILALVAAWLLRQERSSRPSAVRAPRRFLDGRLAVAGFNAVLVACAGASLGWSAVAAGAVALAVAAAIIPRLVDVRRRLAPTRGWAQVVARRE